MMLIDTFAIVFERCQCAAAHAAIVTLSQRRMTRHEACLKNITLVCHRERCRRCLIRDACVVAGAMLLSGNILIDH